MKITVETLVNAPLANVWSAYITPEDIKQWNTASDDWHTTKSTVDLRVGGQFSSRMEAKDGSFGFDFAATEWFRNPTTDRYSVRVAVPDLPTPFWDELTEAIARWWLTHQHSCVAA